MIKVDKDKCIGCGSCVAIAANTFDFDDDGLATAINPVSKEDTVQDAIDNCPVEAISNEKE